MRAEGLSQRALAARLGISQGHLSKVLAGKIGRELRALRALRAFADGAHEQAATDAERLLLAAARAVLPHDANAMHLLAEMMHQVARVAARARHLR